MFVAATHNPPGGFRFGGRCETVACTTSVAAADVAVETITLVVRDSAVKV